MESVILGRRVGYEDVGRGMPVVLIHAFPLNRVMWLPQWSELAGAVRVIAPDLRGFGESDMGTGEDVALGTYADDLYALLDVRGIRGPVVLCGLSMGGYIAFAFLRRYPDRVAALILANTRSTPDNPEARLGRDNNIRLVKEKGVAALAENMLPKMLAPETYQARPELAASVMDIMTGASVPGVVSALAAMRDRPDSTMLLSEFQKRVLVIAGAEDALMPRDAAETMQRAATNGRLVLIPQAGHLSNLEQPELFNRAVIDFVSELGY